MTRLQEVLQNTETLNFIADAVGYNSLKEDDSLYIHNNNKHFAVWSRYEQEKREHQGYTLCVDELTVVLNRVETSDDGIEEARIIIDWMKSNG